MKYIVDTDVLAHIDKRTDKEAVYASLIRSVHGGGLCTVEQVFGELKKWPSVCGRFTPIKKYMQVPNQYHPQVTAIVGYISESFDFLFDLTGSKNPDPADPWLIAYAKVHGYTVVTDERVNSTKRIPFVCKQQSIQVPCINGVDLIGKLGK